MMFLCALLATWNVSHAQDGDPADLGPMDVHEVVPIGLNQDVLVIYAQADDHRILAGDLAGLNATEDQKVADFTAWFDETSWGVTTLDATPQRDTGGNWYVLPEGILDYATPSGIRSVEFRDATLASSSNPTPPDGVTASAVTPSGSDPASDFDASEAGDYRYAVSGFRNGVESTLTRLASAVTVAEGEIVKLTITQPAAGDVDRYIVYRTGKGQADSLANYRRIGYADVTGATDEYVDRGASLSLFADHSKLLTAAMEAADADIADYEAFDAVIVILFSSFLRGQASGAQTFDVNGTMFKIETINQSSSTGFGRFTHEIGHWIGLPDQYDPITAGSRGYWTTMDGANDRQYAGWEKDFKLGWIETPANVKFLERPDPGMPDFDDTFLVVPTAVEELSSGTVTAIKIKSSESVHYYVEGRDAIAGNVSDTSPNNFVVVMEAVDAWPPGIYPKRTLNEQEVLSAGDPAYQPDPTIEITFVSVDPGPPEAYNVNVKIKAEEQSDPKITPWGAPPWESPDIWIDSEREGGGWDDPATAVPKPQNGEATWVDHVNRVYAKISNIGGGDATGVTVRFRVNTPGGIGDSGTFVDLITPPSVDIPAGESRNVYAEWTPTVGEHTCIKVEIEHIPGEADIYNNFAQENVTDFYTGSSSPWKPVTIPVRVANPFKETKRVDLEINGLETGWKASLANKWVMLDPKSFKTVDVTITPPPDAPPCTSLMLDVYGMTQIDDFIQVYGGLNPIIHLADPISFEKVRVGRVPRDPDDRTPAVAGNVHRFSGVTAPVLKQAEIAIIVTDPKGEDEVYFTTTDDLGAFDADFPTNQPGTWTVYAYYAGDDCNAPTEGDPITIEVPVAGGTSGNGGGGAPPTDTRWCSWCCWISIILLLLVLIALIVIWRTLQARSSAMSAQPG